MSTEQIHRGYVAITIVVLLLASFFAVLLTGNVRRMLTSDPPPIAQTISKNIVPPLPSTPSPTQPDDIRVRIATYVEHEPAAVREIYAAFMNAPLWVEVPGNLKNADSRLKDLKRVFQKAEAEAISLGLPNKGFTDPAQADVALTREAVRLANAFRLGAVPADKLGGWLVPAEDYDPVPDLIGAIRNNTVANYYKELSPQDAQYKDMVTGYRTYREIAARGGWPSIDGDTELKLGTADPRIAILRQRLAAEGYLAAKNSNDTDLERALRAFQVRHGLEPDGRIGRGTRAALNVPVATRIQQIAANLERHRHTPRERGDTHVAVNSAANTLVLTKDGETKLRMNVVTGDKRHATPVLSVKMTGVTLNPRWEIPPSIAAKEILPKLQANPRYLAENNMTIVDGVAADSTGEMIDWSQYSPKAFPMRLRQQPGGDNALGVLKFQMANPYNIYLHDTPSKKAFVRKERHLSHGCVRLAEPVTLAAAVLASANWDEASLTAAIAEGETHTVTLKKPIPVHIDYWTAYTENGALHFRPDVYDRDLPLVASLGLKTTGRD